ncbi:hypothetical protein M0802_012575 [Mischocyttarus mexicanus]|nr:hypothetical protein M0802_012575 [Mischocyttarus mexicanus]
MVDSPGKCGVVPGSRGYSIGSGAGQCASGPVQSVKKKFFLLAKKKKGLRQGRVLPAARVRFSDWRIDEEECLSDHKLISMVVEHEAEGAQSLANQLAWGRRSPTWARSNLDKEALEAYLVPADWVWGVRECDNSTSGCTGERERSQLLGQRLMLLEKSGNEQGRCLSPAVVDLFNAARTKAKKDLGKAIKDAKRKAWEDLLQTIDRDPWGKPYKMVMGRLRPAAPPITSVLEAEVLVDVLGELFPCPRTSTSGEGRQRNEDGAEIPVVSRDELQAAAKDVSLDGITGCVVKAAVDLCGDRISSIFNRLVLDAGEILPEYRKGGVLVDVRRRLKYLGLTLDLEWSFRPHFAELVLKMERVVRALCRLLSNLHGPCERKRRLYSSVIYSVLLYGVPVWWHAAVGDRRIRKNVSKVQRKVALRVCCAYKTVSHSAAIMIAGIIPLYHLAPHLAECFWDEELDLLGTGAPGERVRQALAERLVEWTEQPPSIRMSFHATQLVTGHGCFPAYLCRFRLAINTRCYHCDGAVNDVTYTLAICPAWGEARRSLTEAVGGNLTLPAIVEITLRGVAEWEAFQSFSGLVMKEKEAAERQRELEESIRVRTRPPRA